MQPVPNRRKNLLNDKEDFDRTDFVRVLSE